MIMEEKLSEIVCEALSNDNCIGCCNYPYCPQVKQVVNALVENGVILQN